MTPVSNFQDSPDGCKHSLAIFSRQHLLRLSHQGKVRCLVFSLASPASLDRRYRCAKIWPQIFTHLWFARSTELWVAPRSRLGPTTVSALFFPLFTLEPSTLDALIRSLHCSATDRPSRTICICNSASADSVAAFVFCFLCLVFSSIGNL